MNTQELQAPALDVSIHDHNSKNCLNTISVCQEISEHPALVNAIKKYIEDVWHKQLLYGQVDIVATTSDFVRVCGFHYNPGEEDSPWIWIDFMHTLSRRYAPYRFAVIGLDTENPKLEFLS